MKTDKIPVHIISCYVAFCGVLVRAETSDVLLFGNYQDIITQECEQFMVETEFETLNELLNISAADEACKIDNIISRISELPSRSPNEDHVINFIDGDELHFNEQVFSFTLLVEEGQDFSSLDPEHLFYQLNGFLPMKGNLDFYDIASDEESDEDRLSFYHKVLAVRYRFYLQHLKNMRHTKAAQWANLADPVVFRLAELQYKLMSKEEG